MMKLLKLLFLVLCISLHSCKTVWYHADTEAEQLRVSPVASSDDPDIVEMIAPYKEKLNDAMTAVIANNKKGLYKGKPDGELGKWMADAMKQEAQMLTQLKIDFAIQNYGGVRIPFLAEGDITVGKIYELMPFENYMVMLTLDASTLQQVLDRIAGNKWWPVSDGLSFVVQDGKATDILINGAPIDSSKEYVVCLPDYIANGGDGYKMLIGQKREDSEILIRDALINYLEKITADGQALNYTSAKRITYE